MSRQKGNPVLFVIVHMYTSTWFVHTYISKVCMVLRIKTSLIIKSAHGVKLLMKLLTFEIYNLTKYFHSIQDWKYPKLWKVYIALEISYEIIAYEGKNSKRILTHCILPAKTSVCQLCTWSSFTIFRTN